MKYKGIAKIKRYLYKTYGVKASTKSNQRGSAIVIALLVMVLLMGFVALAVSRTSNETVASSNDTAETMAFEASQASLEVMTHNFDKIFDLKLNPDKDDLKKIRKKKPAGFTKDYQFTQDIEQTQDSEVVAMTGQQFQGLSAIRDEWEINATATDKYNGVQVALQRKFFNNRIPIFQFGIFYDTDLEFHPGPRFDFGGRVHSNRHLFLKATQLYFSSKVTSAGEIFTDIMRNGKHTPKYTNGIKIKNAVGKYISLDYNMGSVLNRTPNGAYAVNEEDMPKAYKNAKWEANAVLFQGNLLAKQNKLDLPLKIASTLPGQTELNYIELIKRGKNIGDLYQDRDGNITPVDVENEDSIITSQERYYNKPGIRISLADSKAKLPGCASGIGTTAVSTVCGIRLDGDSAGQGGNPGSGKARGYQPRAMKGGYKATRVNGERFFRDGAESWIKIETTVFDIATGGYLTKDITEDILSLGVTEPAPLENSGSTSGKAKTDFGISTGNYYSKSIDGRSIVKLQRFAAKGGKIDDSGSDYISNGVYNGKEYSFVVAEDKYGQVDNGFIDHSAHMKSAIVGTMKKPKIVPFPIKMFDTREGVYNDGMKTGTVYGDKIPSAGVMSMIDIDVANLKRFLDGDFNGDFPSGTPFQAKSGKRLVNTDIPDSNGWVVYVSDRRGDYDFDGEYDMEDIYGNNDGIKQFGEDINDNGKLDTDYINEAVRYTGVGESIEKGLAATVDHTYYRRGVRLINAERLPGVYDSVNPANTKGFTFATENGVYTKGNYNATGITKAGTPTASSQYSPQNTPAHVPASVVGDAITILSNEWSDANSFENPFNRNNRRATETTVRYAILAGHTRSSLAEKGEPNQGGTDIQLTGGVHNFKRTLEHWGGKRLNYTGSIINLYNSRNNNAAFKCCNKVYGPPTRNWVFDSTFLDPDRLPPGTPFFQTIQLTGFQRIN